MKIKFREKFEKDIDIITSRLVLESIAKIIDIAEKAQKPQDIPQVKKMKGDKTAYRIRIGTYRIGIYILKDTIEFTRVLPRDMIYDYFPE